MTVIISRDIIYIMANQKSVEDQWKEWKVSPRYSSKYFESEVRK